MEPLLRPLLLLLAALLGRLLHMAVMPVWLRVALPRRLPSGAGVARWPRSVCLKEREQVAPLGCLLRSGLPCGGARALPSGRVCDHCSPGR